MAENDVKRRRIVPEPVGSALPAASLERRRRRLEAERAALPIAAAADALLRELRATQVLVLVGETGSGKSTQLPQLLLSSGLLGDRAVAVTQPRRVAAVSLARRVAEEVGCELGAAVGYSVRFDDASGPETRIRYVTDGLLLREALSDPLLSRYAVVVVDEAHERSVHTDVLLGLLRGLLPLRPNDFRLVVTSATLDADAFLAFFGGAGPTRGARVLGRQHPVSLRYTQSPEEDYLDGALLTCLQVHSEAPLPGDILVFLTGSEEIEALARLLRDRAAALPASAPRLLPVPLFAAQSNEAQAAVFEPAPAGCRKVVLATNIAETSLTIPGVRTVVDCGLAKQRSFSARTGAESLLVQGISRSAARQRAGRAGREAPGTCYRLYTEASFAALPAETQPELLRSNLGGVVLQLKALGVGDVLAFPLLDAPPRAALLRALELLFALGALDDEGALTDEGRAMAALPLEPMAAKALLAGARSGCRADVVAVLAVLSADSVLASPFAGGGEGREEREAAARAARARFLAPDGDHVTYRNLLAAYAAAPRRQRPDWCRDHFVNARALARAADVARQLTRGGGGEAGEAAAAAAAAAARAAAASAEEAEGTFGGDSSALRRALVCGYFLQAARRQPDGTYRTLAVEQGGGQSVLLHPSSVLFAAKPPPTHIIFNEMVRTSKLYVRDASAIEGAWLPELAPRYFKAAI